MDVTGILILSGLTLRKKSVTFVTDIATDMDSFDPCLRFIVKKTQIQAGGL